MVRSNAGAEPLRLPVDRLRHEIDVGMIAKESPVSLDGGDTWIPAWRAIGLSAPATAADAVANMKHVIPIGRSIWAIVTGYLALPTVIVDQFLVLMVAGALTHPITKQLTAESFVSGVLGPILIAFVIGVPAQLLTAILARRALARDPKLLGRGRVLFSLICVGTELTLSATFLTIVLLRA